MDIKKLALCSAIAAALALGIGLMALAQDQGYNVGGAKISQSSQTTKVSPVEEIWEMLGQVSKTRVVDDLRRFTGEEPICTSAGCYTAANRLTGSEGLHRAMDYIYEDLANLGYLVEFRDWSRSGKADRNLIARKVGMFAPSEEVFFVAHVDGVKMDEGDRFPAADDNASGAVDLLEVGRILSTYSFSRTLVLLFSTGEEQGAQGVKSYLDGLSSEELSSIEVVVNVDMVGYDANRDGVMELWHGDHLPSLAVAQLMGETIGTYQLDLVPRILVGCG